MLPNSENPAGQLRTVVELLRQQPGRISAGEAWGNVVGMDSPDTSLLITAVAKTIELSSRAQRAVSDAGLASPVNLKWVAPVEAALAQSADFGRPLRLVHHHLTDATVLSLQACAEAIASTSTAASPDMHIDEAIRLTDELLAELHEADLSPQAHELMVRHVLALQQALKLYPVVGMDGLYDAMLSTYAALGVAARPEDGDKRWYQRFSRWMGGLADALTIGQSVSGGASDIMNALPPGTGMFG